MDNGVWPGGGELGRRVNFKAPGLMSAPKSLCGGDLVGRELRRLLLKLCLPSKHSIFTWIMYLFESAWWGET